jgi:hypothetical protein
MSDDSTKDMFSRRGFLGIGSAALAAAGMLSVDDAVAQDQKPNPTLGNRSASDPGPGNPPLDAQNPDSAWPFSAWFSTVASTGRHAMSSKGVNDGFEDIVGASGALRGVLALVRTVAPTDSTALIEEKLVRGRNSSPARFTSTARAEIVLS